MSEISASLSKVPPEQEAIRAKCFHPSGNVCGVSDRRCRNFHPRGLIERELVGVWEQVLNVCPIGVDDNFFDLGEHSLAATRVVPQVIKKFQLELPLKSLFQSPTIAEMGAVITEHQGKALAEEELKRVLAELELMSDEEAQRLVAKELVIK